MLVIHKRDQHLHTNTVYIGRPSKYGNPYVVGVDGTRTEVIALYREYLGNNPRLVAEFKKKLKGKVLVCWCKPRACHGDVIAELCAAKSLFN